MSAALETSLEFTLGTVRIDPVEMGDDEDTDQREEKPLEVLDRVVECQPLYPIFVTGTPDTLTIAAHHTAWISDVTGRGLKRNLHFSVV